MTDHSDPQPTLRSVLRETLNGYGLSNMRIEGASVPYPPIELLSTDTENVYTGQKQIDTIVDDLAATLLAAAPPSPGRSVREALDVDGSGDAALNLEGALDTLLIAHGLKESDTVVCTIRRVLGQIAEATRVAEMAQVAQIAD